MSTPDARLSAAERAAFANLEAAAAAADPSLAARLRGRTPWRGRPWARSCYRRALHMWAALLGRRVWGAPLVVVGFFLMALGLSAGLALSVFGLVLALVGFRMVAESVRLRLAKRTPAPRED
jgi:hypothetical protein